MEGSIELDPINFPRVADVPVFKRGDNVTYVVGKGDGAAKVRGQVATVHRDGTVTVEAFFFLREDGTDISGWLGFKYRMDPAHLARWN